MYEPPRILVFIPAYRCAAQIARVLDQFRDTGIHQRFEEVMVLDNCSPDETVTSAIDAATKLRVGKISVCRNRENFGLGGSHKAAFGYAIKQGFTHLVTLHGDDQGHIGDLLPVLSAGALEQFECCLGARFHPASRLHGYSRLRVAGNVAFNKLFSGVTRARLYDLGSGLNLYSVASLKDHYWLRFPDDLTFNYCMILAHVFRKERVTFFPISWREDDQVSNVKLTSQAWRTLKLLGRYWLNPESFMAHDFRLVTRAAYDFDVLVKKS